MLACFLLAKHHDWLVESSVPSDWRKLAYFSGKPPHIVMYLAGCHIYGESVSLVMCPSLPTIFTHAVTLYLPRRCFIQGMQNIS